MRALKAKNKRGSHAIEWLKKHPQKLIITILIGNNLMNILASVFATVYVTERFGSDVLGVATGILTLVVLIFAEIMPKTFAQGHIVSLALITAPAIKLITQVLLPLVWILERFAHASAHGKKNELSEADIEGELLALAEIAEEGGALEKGEKEFIENVLEFSETTVEEVMTPRPQIDALNEETTLEEAVKFAITHSHSRLPVFRETIDHITGIITIRDLLRHQEDFADDTKLSALPLAKALIIPYTLRIAEALKDFQKEKVQIAIIVDEHGGTEGICTLEDLVEEVFGEIEDESDIAEVLIKRLSPTTWLVNGKSTVEEIEEETGILLDEDVSKTISLIILEKISRFPKQGQKIDFDEYQIIVEKMGNKRIERLRLIKKPSKGE